MTEKQKLFEDIKIGDDMLTMENITKIYENGFVATAEFSKFSGIVSAAL